MPPSASLYVATEQIPRSSPPHRAHRAPPPASPPISLLALRRPQGPGWQEPRRMHPFFAECAKKAPLPGNIRPKCMLFEIKMATSSPHASISGRNRAIQDTWRANLAAKGPFSRRGARNHAWREDVASAARPFRGSGMRSGGTGFAPCGAGLACLPHARPLPSRLCPPWPAPPCHLARVHRRRLICVALRRLHRVHRAQPSAAPPIAVGVSADRALSAALALSTPTHRVHRCALAGSARAPTRANRTPALSQPSPAHPWSRLRPPAPRHPPRLTLPRGSRCGSGNSREIVR